MWKISCLCVLLMSGLPAFAQNDSLPDLLKFKVEDMYSLLKEDILNVNVSIASKKSEKLFDAPLSTSVVTKEDILRAGCTSVAEALRLVPGLVVLEESNGNFDIHLRGGSNVQRNSLFSVAGNTTTLVMIDDRPTYNYYLGGTFWETLPIDLNDVERIELVRGPTSAMYGPNAVSGTINIITRKVEQRGWHAVANGQQSTAQSFINNASLGYRFHDKLDIILSANTQNRNRTQDTYYSYADNLYMPLDSILKRNSLGMAYPSPTKSMEKYGINAFLNYTPNERFKLKASLGKQDSRVQKAYSENFATPLTTATSRSEYVDVTLDYRNLKAQLSYQQGTQEEGLGTLGQKWNFQAHDVVLEYMFRIKGVSAEVGANLRRGIYDDTPYVDVAAKTGQFNGKREIGTIAPFMRFDGSFLRDKLRVTSAIRLDVFNHPSKAYPSYHVSLNYKLNDKHLVRLVYARANRSANIIFTYADRFLTLSPNFAIEVAGNQELKLLTMKTLELGYRAALRDNLQANFEVFYNSTENYANFLYGDTYLKTVNGNPLVIQPFASYNIPLTTRQWGATVSVNWALEGLHVRPYLTFQQMHLYNSSPYNNTQKSLLGSSNPAEKNIETFLGSREQDNGMPAWIGGLIVNYDVVPRKLSLNLNSYFFTKYTFYSYQTPNYNDDRGVGHIPSKGIINLKLNYQIVPNTSLFLNVRNLLGNNSVEFYNSDAIGRSFLAGLHFEL